MIKINLASRKQSGAVDGKPSLTETLDLSILKEPAVRRVVLGLVVAIAGYAAADSFKVEELEKADRSMKKLQEQRTKLEAEASKMKSHEELKKLLEQNQDVIKRKLEIMQKLMADRSTPHKLLLMFSTATPADAWLSELRISNTEVLIKGYSAGLTQVSDLMRNLSESAYLTDVNLKDSQQNKEGGELAAFEISAKPRQ